MHLLSILHNILFRRLYPMKQVQKIVLFGPESTGKTTLAKDLAAHYNTVWCPEFVRGYLSLKNQIDDRQSEGIVSLYEDIEPMAIGQLCWEDAFHTQANRLLFCDTNLLTNLIYSEYYFKKYPQWLYDSLQTRKYELYLLLDIDTSWEADPLRDRKEARATLFDIFKTTLENRDERFIFVSGLQENRLLNAIRAIEDTIKF
jgi:HTH-type transcriptional regulator, transcriptional repressor of NAD biosynthesis genes